MLGRCSSHSAHESKSMLRAYLGCREKRERERERETSKRYVGAYLGCREKQERERERERERGRERERNKQTARGSSTQCTNNSDSNTSTPELLLRQNSVTAHARQS
jgi:hypothetical protein